MGACMSMLFSAPATQERERLVEAPGVEDADRSLLDLKSQKDQLTRQKRKLSGKLLEDDAAARRLLGAGKKDLALLVLRKKKQHQQLVAQCETHLLRLDELIGSVEMAQMQRDVVAAIAEGAKTLKMLNEEIGGADHVQQLMGDVAEARANADEISKMLAQCDIAADDPDAISEYALMEAAVFESTTVAVASNVGLSQAPVTVTAEATAEANAAVRQRQASATAA